MMGAPRPELRDPGTSSAAGGARGGRRGSAREAGALTSWQSLEVDAEGHELLAAEDEVTLRPVPRARWERLFRSALTIRLVAQAGEWLLEQAVVSPPADLARRLPRRLLILGRLAAVVAVGWSHRGAGKNSDAAGASAARPDARGRVFARPRRGEDSPEGLVGAMLGGRGLAANLVLTSD